jgi:hypothetical protein
MLLIRFVPVPVEKKGSEQFSCNTFGAAYAAQRVTGKLL